LQLFLHGAIQNILDPALASLALMKDVMKLTQITVLLLFFLGQEKFFMLFHTFIH
jgi:hypothetical protein